jgi:hypothetical protein
MINKIENIKIRNEKGQFIFTTGMGRYKRKMKNGKNLQYSRYVWEEFFGKIPDGMIIHYIDENKQNNNINNLLLISVVNHNRLHLKGKEPWNKIMTIKKDKKWAETMIKIQIKRLETMKKRFKRTWDLRQIGLKLREIANILSISRRQVSERIKRYKEFYGVS